MSQKFKTRFISIDLTQNQFKREFDKNWQKLPQISFIALTQVKMKQSGGGRVARVSHNTKAFCVYIKSGDVNILAYRGKRSECLQKAQKLSTLLNVEIKDLVPRNPDGSIDDDDQFVEPSSIQGCFIIAVIIIFIIMIIAAIF